MTKLKTVFKTFVIGLLVIACLCMFCACGGGNNTGDNNKPGDNISDNNKPDDSTGDNNKPGDNTGDNNKPGTTVATDYIMEAENIELDFVTGGDFSAKPSGASLIAEYNEASGGKYIYDLYVNQLFIEFVFTADKADDNATLKFRFGGQGFGVYEQISLNNDEFQIYVNPELDDSYYPTDETTRVMYDEFTVSAEMGVFKEVTITTSMKIKEGENIVYLLVNNTDSLAPTSATMNAKAPTIDYMKVTSTSKLEHKTFVNV